MREERCGNNEGNEGREWGKRMREERCRAKWREWGKTDVEPNEENGGREMSGQMKRIWAVEGTRHIHYNHSPIQMWGRFCCPGENGQYRHVHCILITKRDWQKELRSIGVGAFVSHWKKEWLAVFEFKLFIYSKRTSPTDPTYKYQNMHMCTETNVH